MPTPGSCRPRIRRGGALCHGRAGARLAGAAARCRSTASRYAAAHVVADPSSPPCRSVAAMRRSTGRPRLPSGAICGGSGSALPRRWIPPSAAWGSTGRPTQRADPECPGFAEGRRDPRMRFDRLRRGHRPHRPRPERFRSTMVIAAYESRCAAIEGLGGRIILMASRARSPPQPRSPDDYACKRL